MQSSFIFCYQRPHFCLLLEKPGLRSSYKMFLSYFLFFFLISCNYHQIFQLACFLLYRTYLILRTRSFRQNSQSILSSFVYFCFMRVRIIGKSDY
jgi:hypothetical protein